jgi:hypothetical protein
MKNGINMMSLWFSIFMVVIVVAGAVAFTFTDFMIDRLYGNKRMILTVVFLIYAVFRGIRIYQVFKSNSNDN